MAGFTQNADDPAFLVRGQPGKNGGEDGLAG
jgi:hypothetical protein